MELKDALFHIALSKTNGIGCITARNLLNHLGSVKAIFECPASRLQKIPGIGAKTISAIKSQNFQDAERIYNECLKSNIETLFISSNDYPKKLKNEQDAPLLLYKKGTSHLNHPKVVGIVGTRQSTTYGKDFVEKIVEGLVPHNVQVVSGLAYGIDIAAHTSAIRHGLQTIGVMANGLSSVYPSEHKPIATKMIGHGALISENEPFATPEAYMFPARNRIIAGLCDAIIIVEAAEKGGALITAEIANSYNRDVFALPGDVHKKYSKGCNNLIKQHKAHLIDSIQDLEYIMGWECGKNPNEPAPVQTRDLGFLNHDEQLIVQVLQENRLEIHIDDLSWKVNIPLNKLATYLLNLEFNGIVKALPGKKFKLII